MPTITPVSSLRSYTEVLDGVAPGAPVFLTKNGQGKYAILDMDDTTSSLLKIACSQSSRQAARLEIKTAGLQAKMSANTLQSELNMSSNVVYVL